MTTSELIQIFSFLGLAGLTAWYAYQTHRMADQSEKAVLAAAKSALAAEKSAASTSQLVVLEYLPICWARIGAHSSIDDITNVAFSVQNVGRGVALRVECWLSVHGVLIGPMPLADELASTARAEGRRFEILGSQWDAIKAGERVIGCRYFDATGRRYESRGSPTGGELMEILEDGTERRLLHDWTDD
jgi:hypothetical protein